jgi:phage shock protein PspC (stress-responsive transcriptional regulator)
MNSQTPSPDDGQPTEPLPSGSQRPTQPLPSSAPSSSDPTAGPSSSSPADSSAGDASGANTGQPAGSSGGPAGAFPGPHYGTAAAQPDFFNWVRSHGIRRGGDRWVGGVSSGVANRLGVDPLIIRGVFIVLTLFAGIGVLLYGLAWALLPEPDGRIHVQEAGAGRWSTGMTGALIATVVGLTGLGGGFWGWSHNGFGGFLWTVFWVGGAIYLIYYLSQRNKGARPAMAGQTGPYAGAYDAGTYGSGAAGTAGTSAFTASGATYGSNPASGALPSYSGGTGGTPYAESAFGGGTGTPYGTTPTPPQPPRPRPAGPGAPAVAVTAGTALLVGGGLKALDATNVVNLGDSANAVVWASAAAVLGLGILVSGLRGRTAGIMSLFAVIALVTGGIYNVVGNGDRLRFQEVNWSPASIAEARDGIDITAGRGTVDLTSLASSAPLPSDVVIPLDITASNVTVVIPDNVPVDIRADMTMGNLNEASGQRGGTTTRESSYNTDEPGSRLVVRIDGTFSNVTIEEGNAR